jgi:hypothetical protein
MCKVELNPLETLKDVVFLGFLKIKILVIIETFFVLFQLFSYPYSYWFIVGMKVLVGGLMRWIFLFSSINCKLILISSLFVDYPNFLL